jgi:hypothetical protein
MTISVSVGAAIHEGSSPLFIQFVNHAQSVGLLGWGISPPQGRYLNTGQHKHIINTDPWLEWDSNPRSSKRRQFMPQTERPLWSALRDSRPPKIQSLACLFVCLFMSIKLKFVVSSFSSLQQTNSEQKTKTCGCYHSRWQRNWSCIHPVLNERGTMASLFDVLLPLSCVV